MGDHTSETTGQSTTTGTKPTRVGEPFWSSALSIDNNDAARSYDGVGTEPKPHTLLPYVDHDGTAVALASEASPEPSTRLNDSADVITVAFGWMSQHADARLAELEADLRATDEPSFGERLLYAAFRTGLSAATAGASEHLAGLVVGDRADALRELVKSAMESGFEEAIALGDGVLRGSKEPLTAFMTAQREATRHQYRRAQTSWLRIGRHRVKTQSEADTIEAAFTETSMQQAAELHYRAARDAWITFLAQARFGVRHSKALDENYEIVELGPTTDLASSSDRKSANAQQPGSRSPESPDEASAFLGVATGVLVVTASLPSIREIGGTGHYGMAGTAHVTHAFLNGVNEIIREQFAGKTLSSARIPRVIVCKVADGDDFTVRINEKGIVFEGDNAPWLRRRALAAQPWNLGKTDVELEEIGLQLLLGDLIPTTILKGTSE